MRCVSCTGLSNRNSSSTAWRSRDGSSRKRSVPDQVHGRLVPRDEQEERRAQQLLLSQSVAALLGLDECRQEVVAQRPPAQLDEIAEVLEERVAQIGRAH